MRSRQLSPTLTRSHRIWTRSNFCWESPRVFSHLVRVCLVMRWTLVNSRSRLAGRTIVTESWSKLSFNSRRLNSRQLSVSFGPVLKHFALVWYTLGSVTTSTANVLQLTHALSALTSYVIVRGEQFTESDSSAFTETHCTGFSMWDLRWDRDLITVKILSAFRSLFRNDFH